jgi:DNA invertase Pin-like site-specific DNA recombinase
MTANDQNHETQLDPQQLGRVAIYRRPAAQSQVSTTQQQSLDLEAWAREQGFTDITVFAERYIPGNTRLMLRETFTALKKAIEEPPGSIDPQAQEEEEARQFAQKPITAILVTSVDRLFPSPAMLEDIALFLNLCASHGIVVLTPTGERYDFRNENDVVKFCFLCQSATQGIERVTLNRLQQGKRAAAARRRAKTVD